MFVHRFAGVFRLPPVIMRHPFASEGIGAVTGKSSENNVDHAH